MKYFELTENIGPIEMIFRLLSGTALWSATLLSPTSFLYVTVLPMLTAYFVLTAIMRWDPIGYGIQIGLRLLTLSRREENSTGTLGGGAKTI